MEMLHAQTDLYRSYGTDSLKKSDHIPHNGKEHPSYAAGGRNFLKVLKQDVEEDANQIVFAREFVAKSEEKSIAELLPEERLKKLINALNESQSPRKKMRIRDLEIQKSYKIYELKDKFNGLSIEIRKIIQEAEELRESEARAQSQKIIIDDDVQIWILCCSSEYDITLLCVDDDDTDDDDDYDDDVYDCVDIEEDGGEIDLDILSRIDISLGRRENVVLDEEEDTSIPTSESFLPFVTIPRFSDFADSWFKIVEKSNAIIFH
ncbi:hypothetical protein Tco_0671099 [Tanacetum coccineum]